MNFKNGKSNVLSLGFALTLVMMGMGHAAAQTPAAAEEPGAPVTLQTTPVAMDQPVTAPSPLADSIPGEGIQPGYSANMSPTSSATQAAP